MKIDVRACVQSVHCPPPVRTHLRCSRHWSIRSVADVMAKVKTSLRQALSMSWIFVSYTHCCMTPQISKFKTHHNNRLLWWSLHLMQFSLVISHCNMALSVFWLSHDSVATLISWNVHTITCAVHFWQRYRQKLLASFYGRLYIMSKQIKGEYCMLWIIFYRLLAAVDVIRVYTGIVPCVHEWHWKPPLISV